MSLPASPATQSIAKSSAVKAGWICLLLGFLTFWIFGFGFLFFSITIILSIVAMSTNQVQQGLALLLSALGSIIICALIFFVVVLGVFGGVFGVAAQKASDDIQRRQQQLQRQHRYPTPRQHTFASPTPS